MLRDNVISQMKCLELDKNQLHPFYQNYLDIFYNSSEAPSEYILTTLLVALGSAISKTRYIVSGTNKIFPNFWVLLLGKSSQMRKSTALRNGLYPVAYFQEKNIDRDYLLPVRTSVQALLEAINNESHGVIVHDELATFLTTLSQGYTTDMKSIITSCFDVPKQVKTEFKGEGKLIIKSPIFGIASASTMDWLKRSLKKIDLTSGFLARFIFCYQEKNNRILAFPEPPDPDRLNEIYDTFEKLYSLQEAEVTYDDDFKKLYIEFYQESRELINNIRIENGLNAVFSRIQTDYFFKFAILEGVLSGRLVLTREDAKRAIYLCTYFMAQATKVLQIIDQTEQTSLEKRVLSIISKKPGITKTAIHKEFSNHLPASKLNNVLKDLEKGERIEELTKPSKNGRLLTTYKSISL